MLQFDECKITDHSARQHTAAQKATVRIATGHYTFFMALSFGVFVYRAAHAFAINYTLSINVNTERTKKSKFPCKICA